MNYVCQQRLKHQRACVCKEKECTFIENLADTNDSNTKIPESE
jgi:hypothetical protein